VADTLEYSFVNAALQETFARGLAAACNGRGSCPLKVVSKPYAIAKWKPFSFHVMAAIAAARADKLSFWSFPQGSELMDQRTTIAMLIFLR
jgi:hypothetical protein